MPAAVSNLGAVILDQRAGIHYLITTRQQQKSGEWTYPDLVIGGTGEAGEDFTLYALLVDKFADRSMAEIVKSNAENCTGKPWSGMMMLPNGRGVTVLRHKPIRRRTD
jgi:hypothetical protein